MHLFASQRLYCKWRSANASPFSQLASLQTSLMKHSSNEHQWCSKKKKPISRILENSPKKVRTLILITISSCYFISIRNLSQSLGQVEPNRESVYWFFMPKATEGYRWFLRGVTLTHLTQWFQFENTLESQFFETSLGSGNCFEKSVGPKHWG